MNNTDIATLIVSLAQIIGLVVAIAGSGPVVVVITGISGFAAVVNYFLPSRLAAAWYTKLKLAAAVCGVGLVILAVAEAV